MIRLVKEVTVAGKMRQKTREQDSRFSGNKLRRATWSSRLWAA
jgi:hypothetical protein